MCDMKCGFVNCSLSVCDNGSAGAKPGPLAHGYHPCATRQSLRPGGPSQKTPAHPRGAVSAACTGREVSPTDQSAALTA